MAEQPRIYGAEEAEALIAAATQGPWRWRSFPGDACDAIWSGPDEGEGAVCVLSLGHAEPYEECYGEVYTAADSDLLAAAPDLAHSVAYHARRAKALEADVARLRAIIAAERGIAAPEGWKPEGAGWLHLGDDAGNLDRYVWPDGRDIAAGKDRREGTWWGWVVDERTDGRLIRSHRGLAPTALEAMEVADAAAEVARG